MKLLTQNRELKPHGIYNWSIPAWFTRLNDGTIFKTCPNAGACAKVCYARNGTYTFPLVLAAHRRNLELSFSDDFVDLMCAELLHKRYRPKATQRVLPAGVDIGYLDSWLRKWIYSGGVAIRIHDAGDFYSAQYLDKWCEIAERTRDVLFYAYTKEVEMFKRRGTFPRNFRYLFSTGGLQDDLITVNDRHADVFPTDVALIEAGYTSQEANDLLAILLPTNRVGIVANNIPHFRRRMNNRRFSEM